MAENAFGRRKTVIQTPAHWTPASELPSLKDLGYVPNDDAQELRAFKQGFRKRRFLARGGLRWLAGVFSLVAVICYVVGWMEIRWLFGVASMTCLIWSFFAPKPEPDAPGTA